MIGQGSRQVFLSSAFIVSIFSLSNLLTFTVTFINRGVANADNRQGPIKPMNKRICSGVDALKVSAVRSILSLLEFNNLR